MLGNGRKVLVQMANHFPEDHPVTQFLNANCSHLFEAPTGDTGIPVPTRDSMLADPNTFQLAPSYTPSQFPRESGVYVAHDATGDIYTGSAIDFQVRWDDQYKDVAGDGPGLCNNALREKGIDTFSWTRIIETPNYNRLFIEQYPDFPRGAKINNVLRMFTQLEARQYEQAVMSAIDCNLNDTEVIVQGQWNPNALFHDATDGRPITATNKQGDVTISFESIREASGVMDTHVRSIRGILNYPGYYRWSELFGELFSYVDHTLPMNKGSPHVVDTNSAYPGVDHNKIPYGKIWALDTDLKFISEHTGGRTAANSYGVSKTSVLRSINAAFVNCIVGGSAVSVLFVRNLQAAEGTAANDIVVTDKLNNIVYSYPFFKSFAKALMSLYGNKKADASTFSKVCAAGNLYRKRWFIELAENYTGSVKPVPGPTSITSQMQ